MIYMIVFMALVVLFSRMNKRDELSKFTQTKVKVAFVNEDENSFVIEGLKKYLEEKTEIVEIEEGSEHLQDALFFRDVEYIKTIPKGFSARFLQAEEAVIYKKTVPNSVKGMYVDRVVNEYLNTTKIYSKGFKEGTEQELLSYIQEDLNKSVEVEWMGMNEQMHKGQGSDFYFNYTAYAFFDILILGISMVMRRFKEEDLEKRSLCSPIHLKKINFQLVLGSISFGTCSSRVISRACFKSSSLYSYVLVCKIKYNDCYFRRSNYRISCTDPYEYVHSYRVYKYPFNHYFTCYQTNKKFIGHQ